MGHQGGESSQGGPVLNRLIWCCATKRAYLLRLGRRGQPYPAFSKIGKLSTCGFNFAKFGMIDGVPLNVVDGRISWQTVRLETHVGQPRMTIHKVAVEYGLNWPLKGKNTPYSTATYREIGLRGGRGRRIERLLRRRR